MKKLLITALVFLGMGTILIAQDLCPVNNWQQGLGKQDVGWGHLYVSNIVVMTATGTNSLTTSGGELTSPNVTIDSKYAVVGSNAVNALMIQYGTATNGEVVTFGVPFQQGIPSVILGWTDIIPTLSNAVLSATGIASNTFTVTCSDATPLSYTNVTWQAMGLRP